MLSAAVVGCVSLSLLAAAKLGLDTPLVTDGPIVVDVADFEAAMLRIPDQYQGEVRMSHERIATLVDQVFVARSLAARARKEGLDQDPAVKKREQQVQENFLADLYLKKIEKSVAGVDLEARARELYATDPQKYTTPEQVHVEEVLIGLKGRTRDMARVRAQQVYEEAKSGKQEFLELALKYSDASTRTGMRGDLGWNAPASLAAPVREAIEKLKRGEISPPVESENGYLVLRVVDRKPAERIAFETAKTKIIATERTRLEKEKTEALIRDIRSSPTASVDTKNVEALVVPLSPELVKRALEDKPQK
jgi:parvulin-like peptidyl-prolyl isomerase